MTNLTTFSICCIIVALFDVSWCALFVSIAQGDVCSYRSHYVPHAHTHTYIHSHACARVQARGRVRHLLPHLRPHVRPTTTVTNGTFVPPRGGCVCVPRYGRRGGEWAQRTRTGCAAHAVHLHSGARAPQRTQAGQVHAHTCTHAHVHICTHMHAYTHISTHLHAYTHTFTYTLTQTDTRVSDFAFVTALSYVTI